MKLFVYDKKSSSAKRIYLKTEASSRREFANKRGLTFYVNGSLYNVNEVYAAPGSNTAIAGGVAGALVGLLAGPVGILIGGGLGTLIGSGAQSDENHRVNSFNKSSVYL
jgi:hypothetical protein